MWGGKYEFFCISSTLAYFCFCTLNHSPQKTQKRRGPSLCLEGADSLIGETSGTHWKEFMYNTRELKNSVRAWGSAGKCWRGSREQRGSRAESKVDGMKRALGWESGDLDSSPVHFPVLCVTRCITSVSQTHPLPAYTVAGNVGARTPTDGSDTPGSKKCVHSLTKHLLSTVPGAERPKSKNYAELAAGSQNHPLLLFAHVLILFPPPASPVSFYLSGKLLTLQTPGQESIPLWRLLSPSCYNTIP